MIKCPECQMTFYNDFTWLAHRLFRHGEKINETKKEKCVC